MDDRNSQIFVMILGNPHESKLIRNGAFENQKVFHCDDGRHIVAHPY